MAAEPELNVEFVQEVEKYPCLYNITLPEYGRSDVKDKTWKIIGKKFRLSEQECKDKWKNLRSVYVRHLKAPKKGLKIRPYYLTDYMQFAKPFIKVPGIKTENMTGSDQNPSQSNSSFSPTPEQPYLVPRKWRDSDSDSDSCQSNLSEREPISEPPGLPKLEMERMDSYSEQDVPEPLMMEQITVNNGSEISKQTANRMFLLSILPDMDNMTDKQRRVFRRKLLDLVDDTMDS